MKYSGRWHTEGHSENILGVGVYYMDVDKQLQGGVFKVHSKQATGWPDDDQEINVHTGAAIVFENSIPHHFRQIQNLTKVNRRRTFMILFVVDPRHGIDSDSSQICVCYYNQAWNLLNEFSLTLFNVHNAQNQRQLPDLLIEKILFLAKSLAKY
ncbi:unnamed protein product, partial [Rotaria sp. Silwood2]